MDIAELLGRGGAWHNVPGKTAADFIEAFVGLVRLPKGMDRAELAQACARREAGSPTAMGRGLAFPHPGVPMAKAPGEAFISLAYPRFPVDWKAPDGEPVRAVFLIVSPSRNEHLSTLAKLANLCGDDDFYEALAREAPLKEIVQLARRLAPLTPSASD